MIIKTPTRNVLAIKNSLNAKNENNLFVNPETYSHDWTVSGATISVVSDVYVHPLQYSFKIQPLDDITPIVISLDDIQPSDNSLNGSRAQFHCQVRANVEASVSVTVVNVLSGQSKSHNQQIPINNWTGCWSPVIDVGLNNLSVAPLQFEVSITISNHGGQVFYLSTPILMNELGFTLNTFVANMRKFVPSFIYDKDKIQEYPNYPFAKLLYVLTNAADKSTVLYRRFYEYLSSEISVRNEDADFRYSELINPEYVDIDYVDWLSQFNGTPLYRSVTSSASTEAIQNVEDSITWQLKNAYFGRNAGTLEAIKECTKQVLSGEKIVLVFPGGQFFQINVYTLLSETPGVSQNGDTSPEVVAIIEKTKPMGFVLNHEAYNELPLILDDPTYGLLNTAPLA